MVSAFVQKQLTRTIGWVGIYAWLSVSFMSGATNAAPMHGVSVYGPENLSLAPEEPFPYVNPEAPKGGHLAMHSGNFTTLNPYALKGIAPAVMGLVFETATVSSHVKGEPGTAYGHLVKTIDVADDHMSITYQLRPEARFSDGEPVTAEDFVFSFELIGNPQYDPMYKQYFSDIENCTAVDEHTVRYEFRKYNQELPLITGQIPILPKHVYGKEDARFGEDFDDVAVGSGPYVVTDFQFGKYIVLKRDRDWWARNLPRSRGCYNFDTITIKVYREDVARNQAFKGGKFDVMQVNTSKDWALGFQGDYVDKHYIIRREIEHDRPIQMQGFVFNLRKAIFQDNKTRYAIAMVYNFPWANENLFYGQYRRLRCYFENSPDLTNVDPPQGDLKDLLERLRDKYGKGAVPKMALMNEPLRAPGTGKSADRAMKEAEILLRSAGWQMGDDGVLHRDGRRLVFELIIRQGTWERIAEPYKRRLRELGIVMNITRVQPAQYQKRLQEFKFGMIVGVYPQSRSPGNELKSYWSSKAAETPGSRNYIGIKNPAVDFLLEKIVQSKSRERLAHYVHALDRILTCNTYMVPHWGLTYDRVLYWNKFGRPETHCGNRYFESVVRDYWWQDEEAAQKLKKARKNGDPLPEPNR